MDEDRESLAQQALVMRCQLGDEYAFMRLVKSYDSRIRYYVRRLMASKADADDLMQDIWFAVWHNLPKLRRPDAFRAWLYSIARNLTMQTLGVQPREVPLEPDAVISNAANRDFRPEDAEIVHVALDRLSLQHKDVLVLHFVEGMTYEEIAGVVSCPLGTVRSRVYYAKQALRRQMETLR